jgi:hypothetical protein
MNDNCYPSSESVRKRRGPDLEAYEVSQFAPHLFCHSASVGLGCGVSTLALITGIPPERLAASHPVKHCTDNFMVGFLRKRGYRVLPLTPRKLVSARLKAGHRHVILLSQLFSATEGTWGVIFADTYYHAFKSYELSQLAFLNRPILSAYLVIHPSWRIGRNTKHHTSHLHRKPKWKIRDVVKGCEFSTWSAWG